jgi:hypothetical protein
MKKQKSKKIIILKKVGKKKEVNKNQEQDKNPLGMNIIEEGDKRYLLTIKPSNIYLKNFINDENLHNQYYSWLSSVYQLIIDLNIPDMETNKSIFSNISYLFPITYTSIGKTSTSGGL